MSRQASPTTIGVFVLGALLLLLAGVLVFGSGKFFTDTIPVVMYFQGDLNGLDTGAAVKFEGVPIGTVTDFGVVLDPHDLSARIPVVVEIRRDQLRIKGNESAVPTRGQALKPMVEQKGLRAQLQSESLVTGQQFIQLAYHTDAPAAQFVIDSLTNLPEIPTIPTPLQEVQATLRKALVKLGELPLEQIVTSLNGTLQGIDRLVNAPEVTESLRELKTALTDAQQLIQHMDKRLEVAVASFTTTMGSTNKLAEDMSKLTRNVDGRVPEVAASVTDMAKSAQNTLEHARQTLTSMNGAIEPNSPVRYEMVKALRDLSDTARALRALADYLERYPNAVIFGRTDAGAK
jgi:paraquat-inducible protein B